MDPLIDPGILEDFDDLSRKRGRDMHAEMIERFRRGWPERRQQLAQGIAEASSAALAPALHALKGTSASLGFPRLAALAAQAETAAQDGRIELDLQALDAVLEQSLAAAQRRRAD